MELSAIFALAAAVLAALSLCAGIGALAAARRARGENGALERLAQMLEKNNYRTEGELRALREALELLARRQSDDLRGMAERLNAADAATERRLSEMRAVLADELKYMTEQNARSLEQVRLTVDEKLSATLEQRLARSYAVINERLEAVYKGIGEVRQLAGSVADIQKVFTNVKLRGTWGEVQLSALLEQMLAPAQYRANVRVDPAEGSVVEFAVLLPGRGEGALLPIDSKFPIEEYRRLIDAEEAGGKEAAERARKNLERAIRVQADSIAKKYIRPPLTAEFAVLFLPLEGLYAESIKMPGLADYLAERRIIACGPTTLGALLTTLQLGYKSAAIEKRSGELWELLSAFRHEFKNFVLILEKAQKKLQEAQDTIESAAKKTRTIDRKLKSVAEIDGERARALLEEGEGDE